MQVLGGGGTGYLSGIVALGGGYGHSVALKRDGTVWTWGFDGDGELGIGRDSSKCTCRTSPVQVLGPGGSGYLTGITSIAAGQYHSFGAVTVQTQAAPANTQYNGAPYGDTGANPVQIYTGSYAYSHTDVAIPGRGPSPLFMRSYNQ